MSYDDMWRCEMLLNFFEHARTKKHVGTAMHHKKYVCDVNKMSWLTYKKIGDHGRIPSGEAGRGGGQVWSHCTSIKEICLCNNWSAPICVYTSKQSNNVCIQNIGKNHSQIMQYRGNMSSAIVWTWAGGLGTGINMLV